MLKRENIEREEYWGKRVLRKKSIKKKINFMKKMESLKQFQDLALVKPWQIILHSQSL